MMLPVALHWKTLFETEKSAQALGVKLQAGDVVGLIGPLGAGKTTFVTGLAKGLGVEPGYRITSPTFVYAQNYPGRVPLNHMDLYRIESQKHLEQLGLQEMLGGGAVCVVEWFDLFPMIWTFDRIELRISFDAQGIRTVEPQAFGERMKKVVQQWEISHGH